MHENLVSVLIPFRDTESFLPECIESILAQTYSDWEVILVDDHSSDQSAALVAEYARKDARIRMFQNKGKGIIPALRTAYAEAQGTWVSRMDSDDIMKPHRIGTMVDALKAGGPGCLAVGQVRYFSHRGISNGYARYETWLNALTEKGANYSEIYKECVVPSPCWMAYRSDMDRCGAFDADRYPEDYDLTFRFYENGLKVLPCTEVLHLWRDYDTRTSRTSVHYAQNYFLDIKLHYFLKLDHDRSRPLVVWGAGNKGKQIACDLVAQDIPFYWLCDNPNKIGKTIYRQEMRHFSFWDTLTRPQSIVTVANEKAQEDIGRFFAVRTQRAMIDYFFFC